MTDHIHWDNEGQPLSILFDDVYFSKHNGLAETEYVFLQQNQLDERFTRLPDNGMFIIGETGFGTGLNFLATYRLWERHAPKNAHLHFVSVEKFPLDNTSLSRALSLWPELSHYSNTLIEHYPIPSQGVHRINLPSNITLTLIIDDAQAGLSQLLASNHPQHQYPQWQGVDAWFLDGFAPSKNQDMWTQELFNTLSALSKSNASLSTFTAAGYVRRGLSESGFSIKKVQGYGHKREMTIGSFSSHSDAPLPPHHIASTTAKKKAKYDNAPWMAIQQHQYTPTDQTIAVIGGGIAGCHTARALANKGYKVALFEKTATLASGASGNSQGIVYAKLSATPETQGEFNFFSLEFAQQFYHHYWKTHSSGDGQQCGVLQLGINESFHEQHKKIGERFKGYPQEIRHLSALDASKVAGTKITTPCLFFPKSGWINPASLCQWLVNHPNIEQISSTHIHRIERENHQWTLHLGSPQHQSPQSTHATRFHTVVIANAYDALRFQQTETLPIKNIRGQVTHIPVNQQSASLATAICGKGYIAPAKNTHCIGATFTLNSTDTQLRLEDHVKNLQQLATQTPDLVTENQTSDSTITSHTPLNSLSGRVGFRCVTPDYLPIVGAVPIETSIQQQFQDLQHDARLDIPHAGSYHPNLYINIGYGSRGLAYTPLCSELLASIIHGDPPPLPRTISQRLNPARFIIRELIRS